MLLLIISAIADCITESKAPKRKQSEDQFHQVDLHNIVPPSDLQDVNLRIEVQASEPKEDPPQSLIRRFLVRFRQEGHHAVGLAVASSQYRRWPKALMLYVVLVVELACNTWFVQGLDSPSDGTSISFVETFDAFDGWNCLYAVISVGIALALFSIPLTVIFTLFGRIGASDQLEEKKRKYWVLLIVALCISAAAIIPSVILTVVGNTLMCYKAAAKAGIGFFISAGVELLLAEPLIAAFRLAGVALADR